MQAIVPGAALLPEWTSSPVFLTALIGAVVVLLVQKWGEALLAVLWAPFRWIGGYFYRLIASRNPFSISLWNYRKHVNRSKLARIENVLLPQLEVPLDRAFAPLRLANESAQKGTDIFEFLMEFRKAIILGDPGSGKTTLMKNLLMSVLNERTSQEELNDKLPVFVTLREMKQTVEKSIVAAFGNNGFPGADRFVASALNQGKMLIILDGLDEVGALRPKVAQRIQEFCEHDEARAHPNIVLVTCRVSSYRVKDLSQCLPFVLRVEPFSNQHMKLFLQGWPSHKGKSALGLYRLIQADAQMRDICRNPLLLTILAGLYLDVDDFHAPSTRGRFYEIALDELLVQRPQRRQIQQKFGSEEKHRLLEAVALRQLESAGLKSDEELFDQAALREASEIPKDTNLKQFLAEVVEINGVLRTAQDGGYTFAHRTFQEFFAARRAMKIRTPEQVLQTFLQNPDFTQVFYFYCGLNVNIPQLTYIIDNLCEERRWGAACRCLLNMSEGLGDAAIQRAVSGLYDEMDSQQKLWEEIETLSSLSQRAKPEFDVARDRFSKALDRLTSARGSTGASVLRRTLGASPEIVMKIVPGLLANSSAKWRQVAVHLLRDIGTDEALDLLVQQLNGKSGDVREEAAKVLADLLPGRSHELKQKAGLLAPRKDLELWPFARDFPAEMALAIADSLRSPEDTKNEAIALAARVIHSARKPQRTVAPWQKQWTRIPRDARLQRWRQCACRWVVVVTTSLLFLWTCAFFIVPYWIIVREHKAMVLQLSPAKVHSFNGLLCWNVKIKAQQLVEKIESACPPNASGASRLLPWNWKVEPVLPLDCEEVFKRIERVKGLLGNPYQLAIGPGDLAVINRNIPSVVPASTELEDALKALQTALPDVSGKRFLVAGHRTILSDSGYTSWKLVSMALLLSSLLVLSVAVLIKGAGAFLGLGRATGPGKRDSLGKALYCLAIYLVVSVGATDGSYLLVWTVPLATAFLIVMGLTLFVLPVPRNPLMGLAAQVRPPNSQAEVPLS